MWWCVFKSYFFIFYVFYIHVCIGVKYVRVRVKRVTIGICFEVERVIIKKKYCLYDYLFLFFKTYK